MNKLKDKRGETLIESLVSVLIAALAFAFLATAAVSAEKINAKTRNTDISFRYTTVGSGRREDDERSRCDRQTDRQRNAADRVERQREALYL